MRWYVEVSGIGDSAPIERLCIEAKEWQSALQEARRLRSDSGPLTKFSIEVLDYGYRAINPELKARYIVTRAPDDAQVTAGALVRNSSYPPPPGLMQGSKNSRQTPAETPQSRRTSSIPPASFRELPPGLRPSQPPSASQPPGPPTVPSDSVPPPPAFASQQAPRSVPPDSAAAPTAPRSIAPGGSQLIRQRTEEPTPENPIVYREVAYAVRPGTTREVVERLILERFQQICAELASRSPGKYVQLAIFDHQFAKRPVRPPLATLAWKDWRGDPVIGFPAFGGPAAATSVASTPSAAAPTAPAPSSPPSTPPPVSELPSMPPSVPPSLPPSMPFGATSSFPPKPRSEPPASTASVRVIRSVPVGPPVQAPQAAPAQSRVYEAPPPPAAWTAEPEPVAPPPEPEPVAPPPPAAAAPQAALVAPAFSETRVAEQAAAAVMSVPAPALSADSLPPIAAAAAASAPRAVLDSAPLESRPLDSRPSNGLRAAVAPGELGQRRGPRADSISDLFEQMHELNFCRDIAEGSEFVLSLLRAVLPSQAIVIQVFDINSSQFVVVRTHPAQSRALMLRTPDGDAFVRELMRRPAAVRIADAKSQAFGQSKIWQALGIQPYEALCGPVKHGGRYLGMLLLANPSGDTPYQMNEANALDYICKQFADFIASRPVVLEADVVMNRR